MTAALFAALAPAIMSAQLALPPPAAAPRPSITAAAAAAIWRNERSAVPVGRLQAAPRDPLKNGAIIGAAIGAATGAILASYGCGVGDLLSAFPEEESCTTESIVGAAVGAGLGALIGAGVDALFERAADPRMPSRGLPSGLRVRLRF